MGWIGWIQRKYAGSDASESFDMERIRNDGLQDQVAAQRAIGQLKDIRKQVLRRKKAVEKQFKRPNVRSVRQSARLGPQLGTYQMSQDIQNANLASHDASRSEQFVAIERQIHEIDVAMSQLRERLRQRP